MSIARIATIYDNFGENHVAKQRDCNEIVYNRCVKQRTLLDTEYNVTIQKYVNFTRFRDAMMSKGTFCRPVSFTLGSRWCASL